MFGEHESESPRVPSPWDPFLPSPPSESSSLEARTRARNIIPKLVPEVEEGNVEYKLKLTHISPARFARLVTQLKWRLLEGGGQAYYELGVADSGALIGLSRSDLEESLETLEMMAGEIGASVIVIKEIEVPPIMAALADKVSGYLDPETGQWADKMSSKRAKTPLSNDDDPTMTPNTTEAETDPSSTDLTDVDDGASSLSSWNTPADSSRTSPHPSPSLVHSYRLLSSNPNRPTAQSSPSIVPAVSLIDDDLALFSMEPEPALRADADDELEVEMEAFSLSVDIEIASVYKPRPSRRRAHAHALTAATGRHNRRGHKGKEKKLQPWHVQPSPSVVTGCVNGDAPLNEHGADIISIPNKSEVKAAYRRMARDKKREEKRRALLAYASVVGVDAATASLTGEDADATQHRAEELVSDLDTLHVTVQQALVLDGEETHAECETRAVLNVGGALDAPTDGNAPHRDETLDKGAENAKEPRLIVEALVVRKMSIEEAFLDFGGFSLN